MVHNTYYPMNRRTLLDLWLTKYHWIVVVVCIAGLIEAGTFSNKKMKRKSMVRHFFTQMCQNMYFAVVFKIVRPSTIRVNKYYRKSTINSLLHTGRFILTDVFFVPKLLATMRCTRCFEEQNWAWFSNHNYFHHNPLKRNQL